MRRRSIYFSIAVFILVVLYWLKTFSYGPKTRLVPLIVSSAGIFFSIVTLLAEFSPKIASRFEMNMFSTGDSPSDEFRGEKSSRNLWFVALWLLGFLGLTFVSGYLVSIPVALLFFLRYFKKQSLITCIIITSAAFIFIYAMFTMLMGYPLFEGVLFGGILM